MSFTRRALFFSVFASAAWAASPPVLARQLKHGTWVYRFDGKLLVEVDAAGERLVTFAKRNQVTEVYLSTGAVPLGQPSTPALVRALKHSGLRVEALLGSPRADKAVAEVLEYNRTAPRESRFDGVHYDYEPWIGSGRSRAWVPELLGVYRQARKMLAGTSLSFAADISAAKLASLSAQEQRALTEAASVLVLMAYEVPEALVHRRADLFMQQPTAEAGVLMIATRVKDFGPSSCLNGVVLNQLDARYAKAPRYGGWATFSYNEYLNPRLCPDDCCAVGRAPATTSGGADSSTQAK